MSGTDKKSNKRIKILIADDHTLYRQLLIDCLDDLGKEFEIVGHTDNGEECIKLAKEHDPDIILLDLQLKEGFSGIDVLRRVKSEMPHIRVMVISAFEDHHHVFQAYMEGADCYQFKSATVEQTVSDIRTVNQKGRHVPDNVGPILVRGVQTLAQDTNLNLSEHVTRQVVRFKLSDTEIKILDLFKNRITRKEVAQALGVSDSTIRNHITSILKKLGTSSVKMAVAIGIKRGIVQENSE